MPAVFVGRDSPIELCPTIFSSGGLDIPFQRAYSMLVERR